MLKLQLVHYLPYYVCVEVMISSHTLLQYALGKQSYLTVCVLKPLTCSASCMLKSVVIPYCSMHWVSTHTLLCLCVEAINMPAPCILKSAVIPYCLCVEAFNMPRSMHVEVSSHISLQYALGKYSYSTVFVC